MKAVLIFLTISISINLSSCNEIPENNLVGSEKESFSPFIGTKYFTERLEMMNHDTQNVISGIIRYFNLLEEGTILNLEDNDYYFIYHIIDRTNINKMFVVKNILGTRTVTYKEIIGERLPILPKDNDLFHPVRLNSKTNFIWSDSITDQLNEKVMRIIPQLFETGDYHTQGEFRQVYYFAKNEYHYFSDDFLPRETLRKEFDSFFIQYRNF